MQRDDEADSDPLVIHLWSVGEEDDRKKGGEAAQVLTRGTGKESDDTRTERERKRERERRRGEETLHTRKRKRKKNGGPKHKDNHGGRHAHKNHPFSGR